MDNGEDVGFPATQAVDINGQEVVLDADADTSITADTDDQIDFRLAGNDVARLLLTSSQPELRLISVDASADAGPLLTLDRFSASPADNDVIGRIIFRGRDDGAASTDYAAIYAEIADTTDATEDARIGFELLSGGSAKTVGKIGSGPSFTMRSDATDANENPFIITHRDSASPADNDLLGQIRFDGDDDGGNQTVYSTITGYAGDVTDTTEDGGLLFGAMTAGTVVNQALISGSGLLVKPSVAPGDTQSAPFHVVQTADSVAAMINSDFATLTSTILSIGAARVANSGYEFLRCRSDYDGTPDAEFRLGGDGTSFQDGGTAWTNGAGFAEMFEWADGNPGAEDRVGITVALDGKKIRPAQPGDTVIGVITGIPAGIGNSAALKWHGRYKRDKFGRRLKDEEGRRIQAENFDPEAAYVSRMERPEWGCVSLLGQEIIRDGQPTDPRWIKMEQRPEGVSLWLVR